MEKKRNNPKVFRLPLQRKEVKLPMSLNERGLVDTPLFRTGTSNIWLVTITIGTPPQTINVNLDTGSTELVLNTPKSDECSAPAPNACTTAGSCMLRSFPYSLFTDFFESLPTVLLHIITLIVALGSHMVMELLAVETGARI